MEMMFRPWLMEWIWDFFSHASTCVLPALAARGNWLALMAELTLNEFNCNNNRWMSRGGGQSEHVFCLWFVASSCQLGQLFLYEYRSQWFHYHNVSAADWRPLDGDDQLLIVIFYSLTIWSCVILVSLCAHSLYNYEKHAIWFVFQSWMSMLRE